MRFFAFLTFAITYIIGIQSSFLTGNITNTPSNWTLYNALMYDLNNVTESSMSPCLKCKTKLSLTQQYASSDPEIVTHAYTQLCLKQNRTFYDCYSKFWKDTTESAYQGTDFANALSLMDPMGTDGDYYCYYRENSSCPLPLTPEFDLSGWWPEKKDKYKISPKPSNRTFNVLHMSDFHLEYRFSVGSEANCTDTYFCCTPNFINSNPTPSGYEYFSSFSPEQRANISLYEPYYDEENVYHRGDRLDISVNSSIWQPVTAFGDYRCDAPEVLINSTLNNIITTQSDENLDFEFAIFTGDLIDHDEFFYISLNSTVYIEERVFKDMKHYLGGIPVYPVLGNHDSFPYGQVAQLSSGFSNKFEWNYELMSDLWKDNNWLDQRSAGYASVNYASYAITTNRGLKIISLNTNLWYSENYYAFWGTSTEPDTSGLLQFLVEELIKSEAIGQRVWIQGHIPTGYTFIFPAQGKIFGQIVERFSPYTIAGIFWGHTHSDQFEVLYSGNNGTQASKREDNAVAMSWISQSVSPLTNNNPSWRYYVIDEETFSVMDSVNYYTKLNDTFLSGGAEPIWEKEYSAREAYDPNSTFAIDHPLNATFWHNVAQKMNDDIEVLQMYSTFQNRNSPTTPNCSVSPETCAGAYCWVTSFTADDWLLCLEDLQNSATSSTNSSRSNSTSS